MVCFWNIYDYFSRSFPSLIKCMYTKVEKCFFHCPIISAITIIRRYIDDTIKLYIKCNGIKIRRGQKRGKGERSGKWTSSTDAQMYSSFDHQNGCVWRSILRVDSTFDDFFGSLALSESKTQEASIGTCIDSLYWESDNSGKITFTLYYFVAYITLS